MKKKNLHQRWRIQRSVEMSKEQQKIWGKLMRSVFSKIFSKFHVKIMHFRNFLNNFLENFRKVFPPKKILATPMGVIPRNIMSIRTNDISFCFQMLLNYAICSFLAYSCMKCFIKINKNFIYLCCNFNGNLPTFSHFSYFLHSSHLLLWILDGFPSNFPIVRPLSPNDIQGLMQDSELVG